jgi:hypothetical protein
MRKTVVATAVIALVMAMAGASSASAYKFSPEGASVTGTGSEPSIIWNDYGERIACTQLSWGGKISSGTIASAGPLFSGCRGSASENYIIQAFGSWKIKATGASTAEVTADTVPSGGTVMTVKYGWSGACNGTIKGPITLHNVKWDNSLHRLTLNTAFAELPTTWSAACFGLMGTALRIEAVMGYANTVTIVP